MPTPVQKLLTTAKKGQFSSKLELLFKRCSYNLKKLCVLSLILVLNLLPEHFFSEPEKEKKKKNVF